MFGIAKGWLCGMLIVVGILCHHNSMSFRNGWRQRCLRTSFSLSVAGLSTEDNDQSQQVKSTSPANPIKASNSLASDDIDSTNAFESSLDEIDMQMILEDQRDYLVEQGSDGMDDIILIETEMDRSIAAAIKNLLNEGPKEPELSPVEKFDKIYKDMKSRNKGDANKTGSPVKFDSTAMLADLFSDSQKKDPFDERKVMMKLRTMLAGEDFQDLFKDPNIGDVY